MNKNKLNQEKIDDLYKNLNHSSEKLKFFRDIQESNKGFVLLSLSKSLQEKILKKLYIQEIVDIINFLDPDEATDLLQNLKSFRRNLVVNKLNKRIKEKVEFLMKFNPKSAAGIMSLDYIEVNKNILFKDLSKIITKHEKNTGKFPTVFVVENGFLIGEIAHKNLLLAKKNEKIGKYVKKVPHINFNADKDKVFDTFRKHPHNKIVVLDDNQAILGVIYSDDLLRTIESKTSKDLFDFAGVSKEEEVNDSVFTKVKNRYLWLIVNLLTAFLAASVVSLFKGTISKFVLLAVYMPIIAGMGGNAGTQTLAIMVRGIALKEVEFNNVSKLILKEMSAGIINGVIIGILVAIVSLFFNQNPLLGLIVSISMIINLMIAGLFGSTIPLIMKKLGKDPATSASIFITTATDLFGFFVFLGLATLVL